MRSIVTVVCVLLSLGARGIADDRGERVHYTFSAEVLSIDIAEKAGLGHDLQRYTYDLKQIFEARDGLIVVGTNANWSIKTIIRQTGPDSGPFQSGAKVEFIVHSPTRVFLGDSAEAKGKVFDFAVNGLLSTTGTIRFLMLTKVGERSGEPGATDNPGDAQ